MPSGDSACCSYQCAYFLFIFQNPLYMAFILPLCMLGRVYAHCHWIGDTIIGSLVGIICAYISIRSMPVIGIPLFKFIMNISPITSIFLSFLTTILIMLKNKVISCSCKRKKDNSFSFSIQKGDDCNNMK